MGGDKNSSGMVGSTTLATTSVQFDENKRIPIVFHWDHGGQEVYVCGSFNEWERIPMTKRYYNIICRIDCFGNTGILLTRN